MQTHLVLRTGQLWHMGLRRIYFYDGDVHQHNFKNFEFKADVMTTPGSNSGYLFSHRTTRKVAGQKGYEVQVNNSHADWRRTGSSLRCARRKEVYVKDNEMVH